MKKKSILATIGAVTAVSASVAAYQAYKTSKKMKSYEKRMSFKGEKMVFDQPFTSESVAVSFSGLYIDMTKASLVDHRGQLDLFAHFSGVDIHVPDHWQVIVHGTNKNSGINNLCADMLSADQPVLTINYQLEFSGLNIRPARKGELKESFEDAVEEGKDLIHQGKEAFEDKVEEILDEAEEFAEDVKEEILN